MRRVVLLLVLLASCLLACAQSYRLQAVSVKSTPVRNGKMGAWGRTYKVDVPVVADLDRMYFSLYVDGVPETFKIIKVHGVQREGYYSITKTTCLDEDGARVGIWITEDRYASEFGLVLISTEVVLKFELTNY